MSCESFDRIAARIPFYSTQLLRLPNPLKEKIADIHFQAESPAAVCGAEGTWFLTESGVSRVLTDDTPHLSASELQEIFLMACGHSVFSHEEELKQGYLTVGEGCRAGVCGTAVYDHGTLKTMRDITSMVFRIPRAVDGCADRLFLQGVSFERGVLLVGEPSSGKTTLLRDIARSLAMGRFAPLARITILDEKGELTLSPLGPCVDLLRGYPKDIGFQLAIRMLSPEFLLCDELAPHDLPAVENAVHAGVSLVATVHGSAKDFSQRALCRRLLKTGAFGTLVMLSGRRFPGEIEEIRQVTGNAPDAGVPLNC